MTGDPGGWRPLLDGLAAERALAAAADIAAALVASPDGRIADVHDYDASLGSGQAGIALFLAEYGDVTGDPAATALALELLDEAIEKTAAADRLSPRFYVGPVGLGWTLSVLGGRLIDDDPSTSDVDDFVGRVLDVPSWEGSFDLVQGLTGLGVYSLERLPRPSARAQAEQVVALLAALAEESPYGVGWRTTPDMFAPRAAKFPDGHHDFGLAHGAAGVVAFLAHAVAAGITSARTLLEPAVGSLLAHRLDGAAEPQRGAYPGLVGLNATPAGTRFAWCYGDPGAAVALLAAGRALDRSDLVDEAVWVVRGCLARDAVNGGVVDAGLCHGAAGLGHLFNRLGQTLGDESALVLAQRWFGHALDHRAPDVPIAGFPYRLPGGPDRPMADLLVGAAGVGLALLAAVTPEEPWWDSFLLVDPVGDPQPGS